MNAATIAAELDDVHPELAAARRAVALAQPNNRLAVFQKLAREVAGYVRNGGIDVREFADLFQDAAVINGLIEAHGQDAIRQFSRTH